MSLSDVIKTALDQINTIAKTETVIGDPIVAGNVTLIPVSKVSIGFAAGGSGKEGAAFGGAGTGGGVSIVPVAFISIVNDHVEVLPISRDSDLGRILSLAPELVKKVQAFLKKDAPADETQDPA